MSLLLSWNYIICYFIIESSYDLTEERVCLIFLYSAQDNLVLHILERNAVSQALKCHFIIDQYLSVLILESYNSIQEDITLKSELEDFHFE